MLPQCAAAGNLEYGEAILQVHEVQRHVVINSGFRTHAGKFAMSGVTCHQSS